MSRFDAARLRARSSRRSVLTRKGGIRNALVAPGLYLGPPPPCPNSPACEAHVPYPGAFFEFLQIPSGNLRLRVAESALPADHRRGRVDDRTLGSLRQNADGHESPRERSRLSPIPEGTALLFLKRVRDAIRKRRTSQR